MIKLFKGKEMTQEHVSELCKNCGLCCYAFHNLGLVRNEQEQQIVEGFGGTLFTNSEGLLSFLQPCPAYNGLCSVYPQHPSSCKEYQCQLLKSVHNNEIKFDKAQEIVKSTKKEVEIIDNSLQNLMGKRTIIVDDYINLFFEKVKTNKNLKDKYQKVYIHFGTFKYLRTKYFDF